MIGTRYGQWTVIGETYKTQQGKYYTPVRCDCGEERSVLQYNLKYNHSNRCSTECPAYFAAVKKRMPKGSLDTIDKWLDVFNNDACFEPVIPAEPTSWPPGSQGKINVMRKRIQNGEAAFHPQDAVDCTQMPCGHELLHKTVIGRRR
jgi:hypothetical protein